MTSLHLVSLHGDIDVLLRGSVDEGFRQIISFGPDAVTVLDLAGVSYADTTLLNALIRLHKTLRDQCPASIVCVVAPKQIRRLFKITGLDRLFPLFDDVASAQQYALAAPTGGYQVKPSLASASM